MLMFIILILFNRDKPSVKMCKAGERLVYPIFMFIFMIIKRIKCALNIIFKFTITK